MATHPFSPAGRQAALAQMAREEVDLLIIGGGITGCGLARDAALRGLKVALVEKEDFGYGTSSRSSKLIHSGIRYLAYGDFALVRESARERQVLRTIAPHLVHPLPFLFPLHKGDSRLKFRAGFFLFDRLAGATGEEAHRTLSADAVRQRLPHLREPQTGGFLFRENITDDARFTLENGLSAALHGALVANHARPCEFLITAGRVTGARIADDLNGSEYAVRAKVVVNATGPWAGDALKAMRFPAPRQLVLSKGIHLLFRASRLPLEGAVALQSPSGRAGFAVRRWEFVYVGTTDKVHQEPLDQPCADRSAFLEVLRLAQDCFPGLCLTEGDVMGTWAGLRPLIAEPGKSTRETSRHDEVWRGPAGLLTVAGGKLTTYRPMARRVMAQVAGELGRDLGDNDRTALVPLPRADLGGGDFPTFCQAMTAALQRRGVPGPAVERITWLYGTAILDLLKLGDEEPAWLLPLAPGCPALRGEVKLAVEQEMALRLLDFMDRRSALLLFSEDHGLGAVDEVSRIMAQLLGWSESERVEQVEGYHRVASRHGVPQG